MTDPKNRRATIRDVARMAGVSPATVSFIVNDVKNQSISEETRGRVLKSIEALNYRPNYLASNIKNGKTRTIGILTSYKSSHMYFLDLLNGIMEEADRAQYGVVISSSPQAEGDPKIFEYYQENRIDGIVFVSSAHNEAESREEELIGLLKSRRIPFSVIYGYTDIQGVSYANTDFYRFGQDACRILIDRGCKNICYVGAMKKDGSGPFLPGTELLKVDGYRDTMEKSGLKPHTMFLPRDFHLSDDQAIAREIARRGYDGVITCWATYGLGLITLLRSFGLRVPGDVRLIALDTLPYLEYLSPALSTIALPFYDMARYATRMLLEQLTDPDHRHQRRAFAGIIKLHESSLGGP